MRAAASSIPTVPAAASAARRRSELLELFGQVIEPPVNVIEAIIGFLDHSFDPADNLVDDLIVGDLRFLQLAGKFGTQLGDALLDERR
jgi:hypothetical protein